MRQSRIRIKNPQYKRKPEGSLATGFGGVKRRFSVMLIPHNDQKVLGFQISIVLIVLLIIVFFIIFIAFIWVSTVQSSSQRIISEKMVEQEKNEANLDQIISVVKTLNSVYEAYQNTIKATLKELRIAPKQLDAQKPQSGDLAQIGEQQELSDSDVREVLDIKRLSRALHDSIEPLMTISTVLRNQKQLLSDIPNLWPISGNESAVIQEFGPNRHPITDRWYIHKGIDIVAPLGAAILASANGKVVEIGFDELTGYGAFVVLEHKYGFRTRYSHLNTWFVKAGDEVFQGQRIASLGNTGVCIEPHLDFQIMLGTQVLDPASFLKMNTVSRMGEK